MPLLYFVDRWVTIVIQSIYRFINKKLGWHLVTQIKIICSAGIVAGMILQIGGQYGGILGFFLRNLYLLIEILVFMPLFLRWIMRLLYALHKFFDIDGALSQERMFQASYLGWGLVFLALIYFGMVKLVPHGGIAYQNFLCGSFAVAGAFAFFATRKKQNDRKKKAPATEALARLLEACKGWLVPSPQPVRT